MWGRRGVVVVGVFAGIFISVAAQKAEACKCAELLPTFEEVSKTARAFLDRAQRTTAALG